MLTGRTHPPRMRSALSRGRKLDHALGEERHMSVLDLLTKHHPAATTNR